MRMLVQRVNRAQVSVDGSVTGKIGRGFLVFLGISQQDCGFSGMKTRKLTWI